MATGERGAIAPGEGERRAQRGFQGQYASSAALIHTSLMRNELDWIGVADRQAGILDDLVLGLKGKVVGYQIKSAQFPAPFSLRTLMLGANKTFQKLVAAWKILCNQFRDVEIEVRFVTTDFPSTTDKLIRGTSGPNHSASFIAELRENPDRSLADWRSSRWSAFVEELRAVSGLDDADFEKFMHALRVVCGQDASAITVVAERVERAVREIKHILPELINHKSGRDRWTRQEFLAELKWSDAIGRRRNHHFPIGAFVQRNIATEAKLLAAIYATGKGYISLVGPPGSGKSTLLQISLQPSANFVVARYLAFLPDESHGLGRAEAEDFLLDVTSELQRGGLKGLRSHDADIREMREQFEHLLKKAGERFAQIGLKTVIVVDGLDHIPREENPMRSLLCEFPLPASVPEGVVFVLGSQHLDLAGFSKAARSEASASQRCIRIDPLPRQAISNFADEAGLAPSIDRETIYRLTQGHPLATRYLVEALKAASTDNACEQLLSEKFEYQGNIRRVYDAAWRDFEDDADVRRVLAYVARAEGSIDPDLIVTLVSHPAVERTYQATKHLLEIRDGRWRTFHNSFRLYLLEKEEQPLGKMDKDYNRRLYNDLASLTAKAAGGDPQRWLELRYRAKAGESSNVIALATPERFRTQLAEGRPAHDIQIDIRLVFHALAGTQDLTQLVGLLLVRDEIARRAGTLRDADNITDVYLALGDLESARGLIEGGISPSKAYEVLDAFVDNGRINEACRLFDSIEPVSNAGSYQLGRAELGPWADHVHYFRQPDQVRAAVERLTKPAGDNDYHKDEAKRLRSQLLFDVARAVVNATPTADVDKVMKDLEVPPSDWPYLVLTAAWAAYADHEPDIAAAHFKRVINSQTSVQLRYSWRRGAAVLALNLGDTNLSKQLFAELEPPSIADVDSTTGESVQSLAQDIVEHAALAAALGEPAPSFKPSQHQLFTTLQSHLAQLGEALGKGRRGKRSGALGLILSCQSFLSFLSNIKPDDTETAFRVSQVRSASTAIVKQMIRAGRFSGQEIYAAIVSKIDEITTTKTGHLRASLALRQEAATTVFDYDHDTGAATARLEAAYAEITHADTPAEQVNEIAGFARAFAHIGNDARAREILGTIPRETLGYSLPPKKDPQYVFWRSVFEKACEAEPANRLTKVKLMTRLLVGMGRTEGRSTAYRLTAGLLEQAALTGPNVGAAVAEALEAHSLASWDGLLDCLLRGVVQRRPELALVASHAWVRLVLPFYEEPYYYESRLGGFIRHSVGNSATDDVETLVNLFAASIEAESVQSIRPTLLEVLLRAARSRGASVTTLEKALARWRSETPAKADTSGGSPDPFAQVMSFAELSEGLEKLSGDPDYRAPDHISRLVESSPLEDAETFLKTHPEFLNDSRVRFTFTKAVIAGGNLTNARELLSEYKPELDRNAYWDPWYGGAKLDYHRTKVMLDGLPARHAAFNQFAEDLARGRENVFSLLPDLTEIIDVVSAKPDWLAIWQRLEEQLKCLRDYWLGEELTVSGNAPQSDEELLAWLFEKALSLRLAELSHQARAGVIAGCGTAAGVEVLCLLVDRLLGDDGDGPLESINILYLARTVPAVAKRYRPRLVQLAAHQDFAVSTLARQLAVDWNVSLESMALVLPAFYSITFNNVEAGDVYKAPGKLNGKPETTWISDPLDWTWVLQFQIGLVSDASGISHMHLRQRCAQILNAQGGVQKYGPNSEELVRRQLDRVQMRLTYRRPVMAGALSALRRVVGELVSANRLDPQAVPILVHELAFPGFGESLLTPSPRPVGIQRPQMDHIWYGKAEELWLEEIDLDLYPTEVGNDVLLAELTRFQHRRIGRTATITRLQVHKAQTNEWNDPEEAIGALQRVMGYAPPQPIYRRLAESLVARVDTNGIATAPENLLIVCPYWARKLGWSQHPANPLIYRDSNGAVAVKIVWWRDGGPRDARDEVYRGEGVLVLLTQAGAKQLVAMTGPIHLATSCWRKLESDREKKLAKVKHRSQ